MIDTRTASGQCCPPASGAVGPPGVAKGSLRIVHTVSSLQVGGMEQFVLRIAAMQQQMGHQVTILALKGGPLAGRAREQELTVRVLASSHRAMRFLEGIVTLAALRPHIVHAHNPTSLQYATVGKLTSRARVVMTDHGQGLGSVRDPSEREWSLTDAVVAVSRAVAECQNSPTVQHKTSVILNGVASVPARRSRDAVREELGLGLREIVGVIVARIDGRKGHDTLLRALAGLKDHHSDAARVTLLVLGDGTQRAAMETLAQELGLDESWVRFLGFRKDVPDVLAASDIFLLPSLTEGLPLSVLEAMSHRLPVIATEVGGVPEVVVPGETGLLIPANAPQALTAAIATLVGDEGIRLAMGAAGYERVLSQFSFEQMVQRYDALYRRLLGQHQAAVVRGVS